MFGFFTVLLTVLIALWLYAMKRNPGNVSDDIAQQIQNRWIIWGGIVLPIAIIGIILLVGIPLGRSMLPSPLKDGEPVYIEVEAQQWRWLIRYPGTTVELFDELHLPAGQPVDLHLTTADVIHSFWVPRLAGKLDTIPGRTNILRIEADAPWHLLRPVRRILRS